MAAPGPGPGPVRNYLAVSHPLSAGNIGTLTNDVHRIYRQHNFRIMSPAILVPQSLAQRDLEMDIIPDVVYDRMLPALRAATRVLEYSLPFFNALWRADIVWPGSRHGQAKLQLDVDSLAAVTTDAELDEVRRGLNETLAESQRFYMRNPLLVHGAGGHVACTQMAYAGPQDDLGPDRPYVSFGNTHMDFFERADYDTIHPDVRLVHLTHFMNALVHEQAHAFFGIRWARNVYNNAAVRAQALALRLQDEPVYHSQYLDQDVIGELGFAFTAWLWGGLWNTSRNSPDTLFLLPYPDGMNAAGKVHGYGVALDLQDLDQLFDEERWEYIVSRFPAWRRPAKWTDARGYLWVDLKRAGDRLK